MIPFTFLQTQEEQVIRQLVAGYQTAVIIAIVAVLGCVAVGVSWLIYEKWFTPQESKDMRKAFRKKVPLCVLGGDDGYADICPAAFSGPEGILETAGKGRTAEHYTGALPRPKQFEEDEIKVSDDTKDAAKTVAVANYISMLANRRLLLRGARIPVWFAYRGKAILTSLYGIVALQILTGIINSADGNLKAAFAAIDLVAIKALFSEQWNESQINAQETDKERKGELKAKKFAGKESLILLFGVMILLVVVLIMVLVVAYYFK